MINGYHCEFCNLYNDILTVYCKDCQGYNNVISEVDRSLIAVRRTGEFYPMTEDRAELHKKFFNAESIIVSQMDDDAIEKHRKLLSDICFEGKAKLNATEAEIRKRKAKLSPNQRDWLVSSEDSEAVSDALNRVKERQKRMSKADKLKEAMQSLGLADADVSSLLGNVAKINSGGSQTSSTSRELKDSKITYTRETKSNQTNEALLGEITTSIKDGLGSRSEDDLYNATKTAAHIANNIMGRTSECCKHEAHEACPGCSCSCHDATTQQEDEPITDSSIEDLFK